MDEDGDEEHRIEVWNRSGEAHDSSPCEAHRPISNVILSPRIRSACECAETQEPDKTYGFARIGPPPAGQKTVTGAQMRYWKCHEA